MLEGEEAPTEKSKHIATHRETEEEKAQRFEENRQKRLQELKKRKEEEARALRKMKKDLIRKQTEKAKKEFAHNPLNVDQVAIYDRAISKYEANEGKNKSSSPQSNKTTQKVQKASPKKEETKKEITKEDTPTKEEESSPSKPQKNSLVDSTEENAAALLE